MTSFIPQLLAIAAASTVVLIASVLLLLWRVYIEIGRDLPVAHTRHQR